MKTKSLNKFIIAIVFALLVPVLTYTVFQFVQIDENEALIKSIYDRQLESILISLNQWCWDYFDNWQSEMAASVAVEDNHYSTPGYHPVFQDLVDQQDVLVAAFLRFNQDQFVISLDENLATDHPLQDSLIQRINTIVADSKNELMRSIQYAKKEGYIKPVSKNWSSADFDYTILLFPILHKDYPEGAILGGLLIHNLTLIETFVARRFASMTNGEFLFAVQRVHDNSFIFYSSDEAPGESFEESEKLWILPDLQLKIKMVGTTLDRLSRERSRKNLLLLVVVNLVFLVGIVYIIRNLAKEMELARIKSNLVANVSHEIRTPIALIRMYSETLEMGRITNEKKKQKYYKTILAESIRLSQLVNNMLDFSKIESNRKQYQKSPHNLAQIVEHILDMYQYNLEQGGFTVNKQLQAEIPEISIDSEAITQAFVNILDNAMKYSRDHKVIKITLEKRTHSVVLSVQDFGIGIAESEQNKIFQKFYRVGDSLVHNTKGSGLGLSLVDHIMKIHEGHVDVVSKVGEGSTFSLVFPH